MIRVNNISFSYGLDPVFEAVNFFVSKNHKVGLVGPNGSGKSTLLKLLVGTEEVSSGTIDIIGRIGIVPQEVKHDPNMSHSKIIRDYIDPNGKVENFELLKILSGLELKDLDLQFPPLHLSGGQKTKLALARVLVDEPDILMLDEPTNFMDKAGKIWFMDFLSKYPKTLILISHDIELINKSIDEVLAINTFSKKVETYKGSYTDYVRLKADHDTHFEKHIIIEQKKIKHLEEGLKKHRGFRSKKGQRRKAILQKRVEQAKAKLPNLPPEVKKIKIKFPNPSRVNEIPVKFEKVGKTYGDKMVLNNLSFSLRRGEVFVLIGPNGSGKSTIIKTIIGMVETDSGNVIVADNVSMGYYSQEFETLNFESKILEFFSEKCNLDEFKTRGLLARFLFDKNKVNQKIESLSGGEKTRLAIALLILQEHNLLVLDEPTTHLDVLSQRIILEALKDYKGTIVLVSHSEQFIQELGPTRAIVMPEANLKLWSNDLLASVSKA